MSVKTICVYCASSSNCSENFLAEAEKLGRFLGRHNYEIIYGGGKVGLMGRLADEAMAEGGRVIGIIPEFMNELDLAHKNISEIRIVPNMHKRKKMMLEDSQCLIALPGGFGTIEELVEAISWKSLGLINIPILIVNQNNYYQPLLEMLESVLKEKFYEGKINELWKVFNSVNEVILHLSSEN
ncbi:MAG: TIGR00730 family Rossman fold protein, partial [FCB group bacterium]